MTIQKTNYTLFNTVSLHVRDTFLICGLVVATCLIGFGQNSVQQEEKELAKVFVIGDYQDQYEELFTAYPDILIMVCQNNIDSAHARWVDYMTAMEDYSKTIAFDLEGVVMWIHFFWTTSGYVSHVAYHLQPQSKFVKDDAMQAFLMSFVRNYAIDVKGQRGFNHYGSVSFPLFYQRD